MTDYLLPLAFLIVVFVAFGLAHRNHGASDCGDCNNDCDKSSCDTARETR